MIIMDCPVSVLRIETGEGYMLSEPIMIYSTLPPDVIVNVLRIDYVRRFVEMQ